MLVSNFLKNILLKYCTMQAIKPVKLIWIDMEMTGLDVEKDEIMEVGCIVTNHDLEPMHKGFGTVIHIDEQKLGQMGEWCTENHEKTGLTEACRNSQVTLKDAERQLCTYIEHHTERKEILYMAGNSIYMDRMFLNKYMPTVNSMLHYRMLDVSSIKILRESWYPAVKPPPKSWSHRVLNDISDSINELREYKKNIFK